MTLQEFQEWSTQDPEAVNAWCIARDKELLKLWECSCGKRLPTKGRVWSHRWNRFKYDHRLKEDTIDAGYYCDACADRREMGLDY